MPAASPGAPPGGEVRFTRFQHDRLAPEEQQRAAAKARQRDEIESALRAQVEAKAARKVCVCVRECGCVRVCARTLV